MTTRRRTHERDVGNEIPAPRQIDDAPTIVLSTVALARLANLSEEAEP
jgi:hypothetical protein